MADTAHPFLITAFLPWLDLRKPASVAGVMFVPFAEVGNSDLFLDIRHDLERILSGYVDIKNSPVDNPAIVCIDRNHHFPSWSLADSDYEEIALATDFLMLAGFARNQYFNQLGSYVNSATFEVFFQKFDRPADWIVLTARRREGRIMDAGYKHGEVKFTAPAQIRYPAPAEIDEPLLEALTHARESQIEVLGRIEASLPAFKLANSDSPAVASKQEAVWMASAFEHLMGSPPNAAGIGKRFSAVFESFGKVTLAEAIAEGKRPEISPRDLLRRNGDSTFLHRVWIEELYTVRGMVIHGQPLDKRKWGWDLSEHLVIGAFVFPLVVKALLTQAGVYTMGADDIGRARAVDKLLSTVRWDSQSEHHWSSTQSIWGDAIKKEVFSARLEGSRKHIEDFRLD